MHHWGHNGSKVDVDNFFLFYEILLKIWAIFYVHSHNFDLKFETLWINVNA